MSRSSSESYDSPPPVYPSLSSHDRRAQSIFSAFHHFRPEARVFVSSSPLARRSALRGSSLALSVVGRRGGRLTLQRTAIFALVRAPRSTVCSGRHPTHPHIVVSLGPVLLPLLWIGSQKEPPSGAPDSIAPILPNVPVAQGFFSTRPKSPESAPPRLDGEDERACMAHPQKRTSQPRFILTRGSS